MSEMTRTKFIFIMWSLLILTHPPTTQSATTTSTTSDPATTTTQSTTTSDTATTTTQSTTTSDTATTTTQSTTTSDPATTTTQSTTTSDPATTTTQSTTTSDTATTTTQSTTTSDIATTTTQTTTTSDTATTTTQTTTTSDTATTTTQSTTTSDTATTTTHSTTTTDPATTTTQTTTTSDTATTITHSTTTTDPATTTTQSTTTSDTATTTTQTTTTSDTVTTTTQSTTTSDTATTTTQSTTTSDPATTTTQSTTTGDPATTTTQSTTTGDPATTTTQSTPGAIPPQSQSISAIPQPSSTSAPVVTTTLPESTVTSKPNLDGSTFKLNFEIYVGLEFDAELNNKSSQEYKDYEAEFETKLSAVYRNLPKFRFVTILKFLNGSVGCTHEVILRGAVEPDQLNKSLVETVLSDMEKATFFNESVTRSIDLQVNEALQNVSDKCNAEDICGKAFRCVGGDTDSPNCVSTCPADRCENGDCSVDFDQEFYCSCHHDDKIAYTGPRCEIVSEKLGLNESTIIGISVGLGGGVIVILAIVLGCMCYRRSRDKKKDKLNSQFDDFSSAPLHKFRDDKVRLSEMRREEVRPHAVPSQITGRSNYGFDPLADGRHQKTSDNQPSDPRYRNEMDYKPHRSSGFDRKDDMRDQRHGNFRSGYHSDEENGDWDDFKPSMDRDGGVDNRLTGQGRPFYDPADELGFDRTDGRRRSSGLSKGQPMLSQPPLLTGSVRDGESVLKHVDTEQTYAIKRPVFR